MARLFSPLRHMKLDTDYNKLKKGSVIGCTVLPSASDPELSQGIALTVMISYDQKYVQFADIEGFPTNWQQIQQSLASTSTGNYRYWDDVFLIMPFNATVPDHSSLKLSPLKEGDSISALWQYNDGTFSTVYYHAKIIKLPESMDNDKIMINFTDVPENQEMAQYTTIENMTVPTVIRRISAKYTDQYFNAITYKHHTSTSVYNNHDNDNNDDNNNNTDNKSRITEDDRLKRLYTPNTEKHSHIYQPPQKKQKIMTNNDDIGDSECSMDEIGDFDGMSNKCEYIDGDMLREHECIPCGHYIWICICHHCKQHHMKTMRKCPIPICQKMCHALKRNRTISTR